MHKFLLIAALCVAIAPVQTGPVFSKLMKSPEIAAVELPRGVQEAIIAELPLKERARLSILNSNFKHFGDGRKIADELHVDNGKDAIKTAFADGIDNVDAYDALLKTLGPHDGNHDKAAQIAGRRGNTQKLDQWTQKYHRLPESAVVGAAESGDFETFRHAHDQNHEVTALIRSVEAAAAKGDTEFLRKIFQKFSNASYLRELLKAAIDSAAANGHWKTVDDIIGAYPADDIDTHIRFALAAKNAAGKGDMAMLQKYLNTGTPIPSILLERTYSAAAAGGHMETLHFLDNRDMKPAPTSALAEVVKHNHRDAFDYIRATHDSFPGMFGHAHAAAIRHNRPEFAQEMASLITTDDDLKLAAVAAAERGDIDLFHQFFSRIQTDSERRTALTNGFFEVLNNGHWEILDECARRYPLTEDFTNYALTLAAKLGRIDDVLKIIKTGLNGVMPNLGNNEFEVREHPTLATAKARLLILAKQRDLRAHFVSKLTPATKLVYADALPDAIAIAEEEEFSADEIVFLEGLEDEFQQ